MQVPGAGLVGPLPQAAVPLDALALRLQARRRRPGAPGGFGQFGQRGRPGRGQEPAGGGGVGPGRPGHQAGLLARQLAGARGCGHLGLGGHRPAGLDSPAGVGERGARSPGEGLGDPAGGGTRAAPAAPRGHPGGGHGRDGRGGPLDRARVAWV